MDFQSIIDAARAINEAVTPAEGATPYVVIPEGCRIEDLERFLPAPMRTKTEVVTHTVASLCDYFNVFKDAGSRVFADQANVTVTGILDYHEVDHPSHGAHRVHYTAPYSREWSTWKGKDGKPTSQDEFALFIEDNRIDVRRPTGADMLEVSRSLQAKKSVEFSSSTRLADGTHQIGYSETVQGSSSKGTMGIPEEFVLGIPIFFGGDAYEVTARLRYRIREGKLSMWYDLYRPEYLIEAAFNDIVTKVESLTGTAVWRGVAP